MYSIKFTSDEDAQVQSTSKILECVNFSKHMYACPSDRHAYSIQYFKNPIAVGRLHPSVKEFFKFIR
jgi:hypothetical protein